MKSRPYKATSVKSVCVAELVRERNGTRCDVGLDTSKSDILVVIRWSYGALERPWRVKMSELPNLVHKLKELGDGREMVIAMEPTGTYADPVRQALHDAGRELVQSASRTIGVRSQGSDVTQVQRYARRALETRREVNRSKRSLKQLTQGNEVIERQAKVAGHGTATVLWAHLRDPQRYHCAAAYRKAMGLNLKERSSGRWQGHIKLTKRGPSQVRRWLYFAALRWCQDPWIRPWYEAKKKRGEGHAKRALVALMRKLALALYYVGKGGTFDVQKLVPGAQQYHKKKRRRGRKRQAVAGSH